MEKYNPCRQRIVDMLEEVMQDTMNVFDFGAKKHPDSGDTPNFLTKNGNKCAHRDRASSILRHAAETYSKTEADHESGLNPILHLVASAAILYIRQKRNIVYGDDE
jgi:hypothetical protein